MILVDSNIPMYLVGAPHPNKEAARRLLERAIRRELRLVIDAEVLQEILHRYSAIGRPDAIQPALDALLGVVDTVHSIELVDVEQAMTILLGHPGLSARDAIHAAIMKRYEIGSILTFERGFEGIPGVRRFVERSGVVSRLVPGDQSR